MRSLRLRASLPKPARSSAFLSSRAWTQSFRPSTDRVSPYLPPPFPLVVTACAYNIRPYATIMDSVRLITDKLEKPDLDDRSYRVVELPNKLEALLVHDPQTDKASASLNVNVGNFSDADDMPGMAHAVEHLLFMGTEKVSYVKSPSYHGLNMLTPFSIPGRTSTARTCLQTLATLTPIRLRHRRTISLSVPHRTNRPISPRTASTAR